MTDQTRLTRDLEAVLGKGAWLAPEVHLQSCGGIGGDPKGWQRHVDAMYEHPRKDPAAAVPQVESILRRDGFTLDDPDRQDETVVLTGVSGAGAEGPVVEVQLDPRYASIELTGDCET